jgi:hypothetical protein
MTMEATERWDRWRRAMSSAADRHEATRSLDAIGHELGRMLERRSSLAREWSEVGVEVQTHRLGVSGMCVRGTRRVLVRRSDPLLRRRYTVAHEVAHLLLAHAQERAGLQLGWEFEERVCERFASNVLVPRRELAEYVSRCYPEPSVLWLREVARHFRASLSAVVIALSDLGLPGNAAFLLARVGGHPKRPHERGLRTAAAAAPSRFWVPRHQRLASMGFGSLAAWAQDAEPGETRAGVEPSCAISPGADAPRGTADWAGDVPYDAIVVSGANRLVAALDLSQIRRRRRPGRRIHQTASREGQLALTIG